MQIKRQANSTSRAKALVDKTKDLFSAFTNALKYSENKVGFSLSELGFPFQLELLTFPLPLILI